MKSKAQKQFFSAVKANAKKNAFKAPIAPESFTSDPEAAKSPFDKIREKIKRNKKY